MAAVSLLTTELERSVSLWKNYLLKAFGGGWCQYQARLYVSIHQLNNLLLLVLDNERSHHSMTPNSLPGAHY